MSELNNKRIVEEINTAFANGDTETFLSQCSENVTWTIAGEPPHRGKSAIRQFLSTLNTEPPKLTIDKLIADGNTVVCFGEMLMKDTSGIPENYEFADIYEFNGNQIVDLVSFVVKQTPAEKHRTATT